VRDDLGAAPLLFKGALGQVGGAHVLLMALGNVEVIETGFAIVE